jgi:SH3-like domain-containing protein
MRHALMSLLLVAAPAAAQEAATSAPVASTQAAKPSLTPTNKAEGAKLPTNKDALKYRSGLPIPRFGSLRSGRAYMRAGPGKDYPVTWVYVRAGIPLEVLSEWNVWRKVRDADGTEGWMDRAMLSTERAIQITRQTRELRARPDLSSPIVLRAEPGVVMRVTMCADRWCRVEGQGRSGYILREQGFGVYPAETIG